MDAVLIVGALICATVIRFPHGAYWLDYLHKEGAPLRFALVVAVCGICLYYHDLYDFRVVSRRNELWSRLFQALGIACLGLATLYYANPDLSLGRGIAFLASPLILAFTFGVRFLMVRSGLLLVGAERVLILGTGSTGIALARKIVAEPELNLRVIGFLDERGENIGKSLVNPGIIGAADNVEEIAEENKVSRVILSLAERRGRTPVRQLLHLKFVGIAIEDAHTAYERLTGRILLDQLSPSWFIFSNGFGTSRFQLVAKRAMDIAASAIGLLLTAPVMLLTALAIWLECGGPVLFRQERTGLKGRTFEILKFRSMYRDCESKVPTWTADGDKRITRVGRSIRKFRIDELPQLLNVLRGEMSLVGPRPERPYFCRLLEEKIPFYALRHAVRPGITGWAQTRYQYGASVEESIVKLEHDLFYIKHLSVLLDLAILSETAKVVLSGRGAK